MGYVLSFSDAEAEVTDFGVCLRQCDQQAANLRLEFKSDFWVCPPPCPQHARALIINAAPDGTRFGTALMQKSQAFILSCLQD